MLARRLLIALAVLMALTALTASLAPRKTAPQQEDSATPAAPAAPVPEPVEETLDAGGEGQRVVARVGQNVTIVVRSKELDTVSLGDLGVGDDRAGLPRALRAAGRRSGHLSDRAARGRPADRRARDPRVGTTKGGPRTARPWSHGVAVSCDYQPEPLQPPPAGVQVRASANRTRG